MKYYLISSDDANSLGKFIYRKEDGSIMGFDPFIYDINGNCIINELSYNDLISLPISAIVPEEGSLQIGGGGGVLIGGGGIHEEPKIGDAITWPNNTVNKEDIILPEIKK